MTEGQLLRLGPFLYQMPLNRQVLLLSFEDKQASTS